MSDDPNERTTTLLSLLLEKGMKGREEKMEIRSRLTFLQFVRNSFQFFAVLKETRNHGGKIKIF